MATQIDLKILELVCSRLCHDLVGPVGAVNNGIELLEEFDPSMADDVLPLLRNSARQAWRRLDFFRLAFGAAGGRESWTLGELGRYAAGWFEGGKVELRWPPGDQAQARELDTVRAKLLLHVVLIAGEALPRGGTVTVNADQPPGAFPAVVAAGRGAALHAQVDAALAGAEPDDLDARSVQAHLTTVFARAARLALVVERAPDSLTIHCREAA